MYLSITSTARPATDLGFLLHKHPARLHVLDLPYGRATMCYPRADDDACTFALSVEVDPVALVREREGTTDAHVNDRPYAASSFLAHALGKAVATARSGRCDARPDLAAAAIPLSATVEGVSAGRRSLRPEPAFAALGYDARFEPYAVPARGMGTLDGGSGRLTVSGTVRLADLLDHLCVLLPALDGDQHLYVDDASVDRMLARSSAWLTGHPEAAAVVRSLTKGVPALGERAMAGMRTASGEPVATSGPDAPVRLDDARRAFVTAQVAASGARSLLDLGCGEGKLLRHVAGMPRVALYRGVDPSVRDVLRLRRRIADRELAFRADLDVEVLFGTLLMRDSRLAGFDCAVLSEVIEHVEPDRVPVLTRHLLGDARPRTVIVTTPNRDHNAVWGFPAGRLRHDDHRFEWDRAGFAAWASDAARAHGYDVALHGIGVPHGDLGHPTQAAVLTLTGARP